MKAKDQSNLKIGDLVKIIQGKAHTPGWLTTDNYTVIDIDPRNFGVLISTDPGKNKGQWLDVSYIEKV